MHSQLLTLLGLIVLSAIFSGSETALVSLSQSKVDELVEKKVRNSLLLKKLKSNPHKLLITVLIGNNLVNIGASAYAAVVFTEMFGSSGIGIATGVMTFLILVFGEITPKSFAHQHAISFALFISKFIYLLQFILWPLVWFFDIVVIIMNKFFGGVKHHTVTEGEIVAMLKIGEMEGSIQKQEKEFIENVLEFNDIEVDEVMTPRVAIEALEANATIKDAVAFVIEHSRSRIPVYEKDLDHIIGFLSVKDILEAYSKSSENKKLKDCELSYPIEVPLSKKINQLFVEFQRKHKHLAIVIDDHGGTAGLVTMEDLLEEIVGEIVDEDDVDEEVIEIIDSNHVVVSGNAIVEDVHDFFRIKFWPNDRDTINTMLQDHLHRFPREGEVIYFPLIIITVLKVKKNVVEKVRIKRAYRKHKK